MRSLKYIIVGGVAGGATAAARIRRIDEFSEIILLEQSPRISYANCGMPYYIGGSIEREEDLLVQSPTAFGNRYYIDVRVNNQVLEVNAAQKKVVVRTTKGKIYEETYDKLLLSPGASAICPPLKGIQTEGIFTLRSMEDCVRIKEYATEHCVRDAVVVGGGFIGLEMAENLHKLGCRVSVVEMANQVLASVDYSIASFVHSHLRQKGVNLILGTAVDSFEPSSEGNKIAVRLSTDKTIFADIIILSIGVRPQTILAKSAGIELGQTGGIKVNEFLETSVKDIYAVGDAIEFPHPVTGKPYLNFLAGPANRQARIVADNMVFGNIQRYEGAIATAIAKVFDLTIASTGLPAKQLKKLGIEYCSSTTHGYSHATYYPGAKNLTIKLVFDPQGRLYGGQCVGVEGVDKRIDQIALVIKNKGSVEDLAQVEQAYAPPYSSAKDPVAVAGYVAGNICSGAMKVAYWREVAEIVTEIVAGKQFSSGVAGECVKAGMEEVGARKTQSCLLDVRSLEEYNQVSIPGAIHIPLDELRERLDELPQDKDIIVFCAIGLRGYLAYKILTANGFDKVRNLSGGYRTYLAATSSERM